MDQRKPLYLEDLQVGQKVVTGTYTLDKDQIIAFAKQYRPAVTLSH